MSFLVTQIIRFEPLSDWWIFNSSTGTLHRLYKTAEVEETPNPPEASNLPQFADQLRDLWRSIRLYQETNTSILSSGLVFGW